MARINERLDQPDNVEVIRDQLAGIIELEMLNQYELAIADDDPVAEDYNATVFVENDEPLNSGGDLNIFPIVNVWLDSVRRASASAAVNYEQKIATFNVDLYQVGNYDGAFAGRKATIKVWKLARCIRAILDSDVYTYLLLRGVVSATAITNIAAGAPQLNDSAVKVGMIRITLEVTFDQDSPITTGENMEVIPVEVIDENGQIVVKE